MKKILIVINTVIIIYCIVITSVALFFIMNSDPRQTEQTKPKPQVTLQPVKEKSISVHGAIPYWGQESAFATFSENVDQFQYLSLFWYLVQTDQSVTPYRDAVEDKEIINFAHLHGVKVLAVITNLPDYEDADWDSDRMRPILEDPEIRKKHIESIVTLLYKNNFDGVNIDYEELDTDLRDEFSVFIKELSAELHKRDKIIGVAIHPKSGEDIPSEDNGSRAQDWVEIAAHVDHMYIMAYGEHWNDSAAGPIASVNWDSGLITYAKNLGISLEKVYLGVPLYAVRWEEATTDGEGLLYADVLQLQKDFDAKPVYDEVAQSPSLTYIANERVYNVWFENGRSVEAKIKLAKESGLGGISFWALGGEDPAVWDALRKMK